MPCTFLCGTSLPPQQGKTTRDDNVYKQGESTRNGKGISIDRIRQKWKKVYKQEKCDKDNKVYKNNTLTTKTAVNVL